MNATVMEYAGFGVIFLGAVLFTLQLTSMRRQKKAYVPRKKPTGDKMPEEQPGLAAGAVSGEFTSRLSLDPAEDGTTLLGDIIAPDEKL